MTHEITATAPTLTTDRLILRPWRESDLAPFAALNADPEVMEHFPAPLSGLESEAVAARLRDGMVRQGFGLWAVELPDKAPFIGFIGLWAPSFEAHFTPCVEVGWRLARGFWGKGYASEGAREAVRFGFEDLGLEEIVSLTSTTNIRSQAVMRRLGMTRDPVDDFDHPNLPEAHPLCRHVLYRLRRPGEDGSE
ncbi:MAG: GNAT family N-acetyltransferase [Kiloniellaceae bacterium]